MTQPPIPATASIADQSYRAFLRLTSAAGWPRKRARKVYRRMKLPQRGLSTADFQRLRVVTGV